MKKSLALFRALMLSLFLAALTPAWAQNQPAEHGHDEDQSVVTDQNDNEDHETSLGWVGLFGLLGAVGVLGPDRRLSRRGGTFGPAGAAHILMIGSLTLALSVTLWTITPALAQTAPEETGQHGADVSQSDSDPANYPNLGWVGLLGLIGLLGLRRGRRTADERNHSGNATR